MPFPTKVQNISINELSTELKIDKTYVGNQLSEQQKYLNDFKLSDEEFTRVKLMSLESENQKLRSKVSRFGDNNSFDLQKLKNKPAFLYADNPELKNLWQALEKLTLKIEKRDIGVD